MLSQAKKTIRNNKGLASIEATVLIVLFISLVYYSFGFFGIVHTGIVHSIHARTYAYETFRHRTNLWYFRSNRNSDFHYFNQGTRLHGINQWEQSTQMATERPISMGLQQEEYNRTQTVHNSDIFQRVPASGRNTSVEVNPVWIMVFYGMCLTSSCGGG